MKRFFLLSLLACGTAPSASNPVPGGACLPSELGNTFCVGAQSVVKCTTANTWRQYACPGANGCRFGTVENHAVCDCDPNVDVCP